MTPIVRCLVVVPFLLLSDGSASAFDAGMADTYATDTLLCRGPFKIRYIDSAMKITEPAVDDAGNVLPAAERIVSGTYLIPSIEIPVTVVTGTVGFGVDLERGQCGWAAGKNPVTHGVLLRGAWIEKNPLRRTIEQDTTGKQTTSYDFALAQQITSPTALFLFKVGHQNGSPSSNSSYVFVDKEPKIVWTTQFKKP